jgi:hypothetical protein
MMVIFLMLSLSDCLALTVFVNVVTEVGLQVRLGVLKGFNRHPCETGSARFVGGVEKVIPDRFLVE